MDQVINSTLLAEDIELHAPEIDDVDESIPAPINVPFEDAHPNLPADSGFE